MSISAERRDGQLTDIATGTYFSSLAIETDAKKGGGELDSARPMSLGASSLTTPSSRGSITSKRPGYRFVSPREK